MRENPLVSIVTPCLNSEEYLEYCIKWCTGIPSNWNERGVQCLSSMMIPVYPRRFIKNGYMDGRVGLIIQQESTFWTKNLWDKCGNIAGNGKLSRDFYLMQTA